MRDVALKAVRSRAYLIRWALGIACVPIAWSATQFTNSLIAASTDPEAAVRQFPTSQALANLAIDRARKGEALGRAEARALALRSLAWKPANPEAAAALGLAAEDPARSALAFRYSEVMSRRNVVTQLALVEAAVSASAPAEALKHYDRAMRVSLPTRVIMFPILTAAASDPELQPMIAKYVAARPSWASSFVDELAGKGSDPHAIAAVVSAYTPDIHNDQERAQLSLAVSRLVDLRAVGAARDLFLSVCKGAACLKRPYNGDFNGGIGITPFDWAIQDDQAAITAIDDGNMALELSGWRGGPLARQLMALSAGSYELQGKVDNVEPASAVTFSLSCAGQPAPFTENSVSKAQRFSIAFEVTVNCSAVWLTLSEKTRLDRPTEPVLIDDLSIISVSARAAQPK